MLGALGRHSNTQAFHPVSPVALSPVVKFLRSLLFWKRSNLHSNMFLLVLCPLEKLDIAAPTATPQLRFNESCHLHANKFLGRKSSDLETLLARGPPQLLCSSLEGLRFSVDEGYYCDLYD